MAPQALQPSRRFEGMAASMAPRKMISLQAAAAPLRKPPLPAYGHNKVLYLLIFIA